MRLPRSTWGRLALVLPALAAMVVVLVWRGPDWGLVADAFRLVVWEWVVVAILLLGNMAMSGYVLLQLRKLPADQPLGRLLTAQNA